MSSLYNLEIFIDIEAVFIGAAVNEIVSGKRQKLPLPDAGPEQDIESQPAGCLFLISNELFKLIERPDLHCGRVRIANGAYCSAGILCQLIIDYSIIQYGRKLIIDGF